MLNEILVAMEEESDCKRAMDRRRNLLRLLFLQSSKGGNIMNKKYWLCVTLLLNLLASHTEYVHAGVVQKLPTKDIAHDGYDYYVSVDGDTAVIGQGVDGMKKN